MKTMECDVLIAGAGPAGCSAAIACARTGARPLLVEMTGTTGGMGTGGLIPSFAPFSDGVRIIHRGIALEMLSRMTGISTRNEAALPWTPINPERLARVYDDLLTGAGVHPLHFATVCEVEKNTAGAIGRVTIATKAGLIRVSPRVVIDCTGDGDVAAQAGAEWVQGDADGVTMPASLCFRLGGVRNDRRNVLPPDGQLGRQLQDNPKYDLIQTPHLIGIVHEAGVVAFNAGHIWEADSNSPERISECMRLGRRMAEQYRDGLAELCPEVYGNAVVLSTAPLLGVRETRRITGEYVLTVADYFARRTFADQIACNHYGIDIHHSKQEANDRKMESVMDRYEQFKQGETHGIPYRSLVVKGISNLLMAGRCISCERPVQASLRVMPVCLSTGQAAGTAAALAADAHTSCRDIDTDRLRAILREQGVYLGNEPSPTTR